MSDQMARQWVRLLIMMLISIAIVGTAAYLVPPYRATKLTSMAEHIFGGSITNNFLPRFRAYESPSNALLAVIATWLCAPLCLFSGLIFSLRIIRENVRENVPTGFFKWLFRLLVLSCICLGVLFAAVWLPGTGSVFCRSCERNSMLFMLSVCLVGFFSVGAIVGVIILTAKYRIDNKEDEP